MRGRRIGAVFALCAALTITTAAPALAAPGVCAGHEAPPGPAAVEEGPTPVAPLPVPAEPVGGPLLGTCGDVLPPGAPAPPPTVTAAGWVIADLDTGAVLAAHDPHGRQRPASTLKLLTTLVVLQRLELDQVVVGDVTDTQVDGSRVGVGPGGQYTVGQLVSGLLLNSGNDAAQALARTLGGVPATLDAMQRKAAELGGLDTRPATPSGLDGPGMSTSAYDLALLLRAALRNPTFAELTATKLVPFPGFGTHAGFTVSNDDPLLAAYPGAIGGKTGFTDAARHTFVGAARRDGRRLVVALVRGEQHPVRMVAQAGALLDYGFALPAATRPVGTLVESAPRPPDTPEPRAAAAAASTAQPTVATPAGWYVGGAAILLVAAGAVLFGLRRTGRR